MPIVTITTQSATEVKLTIDDEEFYYKKCYCYTQVRGDYLLFFAHQAEINAYRQQYEFLYSDVTSPSTLSAAQLKVEVDFIIQRYGIVDLAYLSYVDRSTQTNDNLTNFFTYNTKELENGITIANNSEITFSKEGKFNIQFSAQVEKTDSGRDQIEIWLVKNGNNVPNSSTIVQLDGNNDKHVAAWNWLVSANINDYYQIAWYSVDPNVQIVNRGTLTLPDRPEVPSVIITVHQVEGGNV